LATLEENYRPLYSFHDSDNFDDSWKILLPANGPPLPTLILECQVPDATALDQSQPDKIMRFGGLILRFVLH
jgi:hypothetical protein